MSIDSRLRRGLERSANAATEDLVDNLPEALTRGRRRKRAIVGTKITAIVAGIAIVALGGPRLVGVIRTDQPAVKPSPSVTATDFSAIAGTYTFELSDADATVAANDMAGTWTIRLKPDGAMELSVPATFTREGPDPAGNAFTLAASQFRTNLFFSDFCHSVGFYRWALRGTRLTFTPLSEDCPVRQAIFASQPWTVRG
jgi:hypothetical protein